MSARENSDDGVPLTVYAMPLVPSVVLAFYLACRWLGLLSREPSVSVAILIWAFISLALVPIPWALRRLSRSLSAQVVHGGDTARADALLSRLAEAVEQLAQANQLLASTEKQLSTASRHAPDKPKSLHRPLLVFAFLGAVAIASATFVNLPAAAEIPHAHVTFAVFVEGMRVNYSSPAFDLSARQFPAAHLHYPDQDVLHLEGTNGVNMTEIFSQGLGGEITNDMLRLDPRHGGEPYLVNETHRLRLFVSPWFSDEWIRVSDIPSYEPRDADRILVTFGKADAVAPVAETKALARYGGDT